LEQWGAGVGVDGRVPIICPKAAPSGYEYVVVTLYLFNNGDQKITTNPIDHSAPFYLAESGNGNKTAGVVSVSYSLEGIRVQLGSLNIGNTDYGFIISGEGVIISDPVKEHLNGNIHDLAKRGQNLYFIIKNIKKGLLTKQQFPFSY
jgi:hypothetical protein